MSRIPERRCALASARHCADFDRMPPPQPETIVDEPSYISTSEVIGEHLDQWIIEIEQDEDASQMAPVWASQPSPEHSSKHRHDRRSPQDTSLPTTNRTPLPSPTSTRSGVSATSSSTSRSSNMNSGIIAACVIGAIFFVAIVGAISVILFQRRRRSKTRPRIHVRPIDTVSVHSDEEEPNYIDSSIGHPTPAHVRDQRRPDAYMPGRKQSYTASHEPELKQVRLGPSANDTPVPAPMASGPPYRHHY